MTETVIALGSNMGNKEENIKHALTALSLVPKLSVEKVSSLYETSPYGVLNKQENYFNCCASIITTLEPEILLGVCLGIEAAMHRVREYKNSPRIIDLDLIFYGNLEVNTKNLTLPHPRAGERDFVVIPILEIFEGKLPEFLNFKCNKNIKVNILCKKKIDFKK